ncbi:MAG: hypothetical protein C0514_09215 [Candidatus Puniceispirillum sp.]|nr:hypothetical protein [Candidatus Puniceispirillum sp.]
MAVLATMILFKGYACDGIDDQRSDSSAIQPSMRAVAESQDAQRHLGTGLEEVFSNFEGLEDLFQYLRHLPGTTLHARVLCPQKRACWPLF